MVYKILLVEDDWEMMAMSYTKMPDRVLEINLEAILKKKYYIYLIELELRTKKRGIMLDIIPMI